MFKCAAVFPLQKPLIPRRVAAVPNYPRFILPRLPSCSFGFVPVHWASKNNILIAFQFGLLP